MSSSSSSSSSSSNGVAEEKTDQSNSVPTTTIAPTDAYDNGDASTGSSAIGSGSAAAAAAADGDGDGGDATGGSSGSAIGSAAAAAAADTERVVAAAAVGVAPARTESGCETSSSTQQPPPASAASASAAAVVDTGTPFVEGGLYDDRKLLPPSAPPSASSSDEAAAAGAESASVTSGAREGKDCALGVRPAVHPAAASASAAAVDSTLDEGKGGSTTTAAARARRAPRGGNAPPSDNGHGGKLATAAPSESRGAQEHGGAVANSPIATTAAAAAAAEDLGVETDDTTRSTSQVAPPLQPPANQARPSSQRRMSNNNGEGMGPGAYRVSSIGATPTPMMGGSLHGPQAANAYAAATAATAPPPEDVSDDGGGGGGYDRDQTPADAHSAAEAADLVDPTETAETALVETVATVSAYAVDDHVQVSVSVVVGEVGGDDDGDTGAASSHGVSSSGGEGTRGGSAVDGDGNGDRNGNGDGDRNGDGSSSSFGISNGSASGDAKGSDHRDGGGGLLGRGERRLWTLRLVGGAVVLVLVAVIVALIAVLTTREGPTGAAATPQAASDATDTLPPPTQTQTTATTHTTTCPNTAKLLSNSGRAEDNFGYSLDISSGTVLVGAYLANGYVRAHTGEEDENSGSAYVFVRNGDATSTGGGGGTNSWIEEARLRPDDLKAGDVFGVKVALNEGGDVAVVGADQADGGAGAAYVFVRTRDDGGGGDGTSTERPRHSWVQEARLSAEDATPGAQFGDSVIVEGRTIVVGALFSEPTGGAAYVFGRGADGTWEQQAKVIPDASDGLPHTKNRFGKSLALSGDTLVVGADKDADVNGVSSGAAYVFSRQTGPDGTTEWTQEAKIVPDDGNEFHFFGFSLDIDAGGDTVVVSSWKDGALVEPATPEKSGKTEQVGAAYLFARSESSSWKQEAKIVADDGEAGDRFGCSVAINDDGDTILVGAYHDDERRGSAYLFTRAAGETWQQQLKLRAENVIANDMFGYQVALDGNTGTALIGEYADGDNGYAAGAVHVIDHVDTCLQR